MNFLLIPLLAAATVAEPTYVVRGAVMAPDGSPLPGATVTIAASGATALTTVSQADGSFVFRALASGAYQLKASLESFCGASTTLLVRGAASEAIASPLLTLFPFPVRDVDICICDPVLDPAPRPKPIVYFLRVTGPEGPIPGATVLFTGDVSLSLCTDATGAITLHTTTDRHFNVTVVKEGFLDAGTTWCCLLSTRSISLVPRPPGCT